MAGKLKSSVCAACHSIDGNSSEPNWPKLAGQHQPYLAKQLRDYKKGEQGPRYDAQMIGMVINLSEQDIEDLASYYAAQKPTPGKTLAAYVKQGQALYRGGDIDNGLAACSACHGPKGEGNIYAKYPRVSGQSAEYLESQLKAFRSKTRYNDKNKIMQDIAKKMTNEQIKSVSEYMSGLH